MPSRTMSTRVSRTLVFIDVNAVLYNTFEQAYTFPWRKVLRKEYNLPQTRIVTHFEG